jgi:hypothetical protein
MNLTSLLPSLLPSKWIAITGGVVLIAAALGVQQLRVSSAKTALAEERSAIAYERQRASEQRTADIERYRAIEAQRTEDQRKAREEFDIKMAALHADAASATAAADRLRKRVDALVAAARQAPSNPAAVASSAPAGDPIGVLADVLRRADERAGQLARIADERGAAGSLCERDYDALTTPQESKE